MVPHAHPLTHYSLFVHYQAKRSMSVRALKQALAQAASPPITDPNEIHLRRGNSSGLQFKDESKTLKAMGALEYYANIFKSIHFQESNKLN